jgi:hypothetical protein
MLAIRRNIKDIACTYYILHLRERDTFIVLLTVHNYFAQQCTIQRLKKSNIYETFYIVQKLMAFYSDINNDDDVICSLLISHLEKPAQKPLLLQSFLQNDNK